MSRNPSVTKQLTFIDLFAGIGGFRIALENNGLKCVFSSDNDVFCQKVYKDNFNEEMYGDITKIEAGDIPDFDVLTAGFPCQPFSYAGRLMGFEDKTRGTLFFDVLRIIKEKRPKMFILENVKGLVSHKAGETVKVIEESLREQGYTIYSKVLNSYDFGLPQMRQRWYCVGFDKEVDFEFPTGGKRGSTLRDIVDLDNNDESLKLSEFELKRIEFHFASKDKRVKHDHSKYAPHTKKGKHGVYSYMKPDGTLRFHIGDVAKTQIQEAYYVSLGSTAPTIIAAREPKLWDLKRRLSVDECRRLQGFPEGFKFSVSKGQAKKQLGNAVSVPVVQEIMKTMINYYFDEIRTERQLPLIDTSTFHTLGVNE